MPCVTVVEVADCVRFTVGKMFTGFFILEAIAIVLSIHDFTALKVLVFKFTVIQNRMQQNELNALGLTLSNSN